MMIDKASYPSEEYTQREVLRKENQRNLQESLKTQEKEYPDVHAALEAFDRAETDYQLLVLECGHLPDRLKAAEQRFNEIKKNWVGNLVPRMRNVNNVLNIILGSKIEDVLMSQQKEQLPDFTDVRQSFAYLRELRERAKENHIEIALQEAQRKLIQKNTDVVLAILNLSSDQQEAFTKLQSSIEQGINNLPKI